MKYLKIKNNGIIEEKALYLMGASTKRGDSSTIGEFGSGNKYALAYLLRNDYEVSIYAGTNLITLEKQTENLRGNDFEVIIINGVNTNITTELGKDWSLWQSLREIYCNAMDEEQHTLEFVNEIDPQENETHFYIKNRAEITEFIGNFDNYFAQNKEVLFENQYGKIYKKHAEKAIIYRKGVKCTPALSENSLYDYDLPTININEDRLVKHSWQIEEMMWKLIFSCDKEDIIRNILCNLNSDNLLETSFKEWSTISNSNMSEKFIEVLKTYKIAPKHQSGYLKESERNSFLLFPRKIYDTVKSVLSNNNMADGFKILNDNEIYRPCSLQDLQQETYNKAIEFLKECGQEEVVQWDCDFGYFEDKDVRGMADIKGRKMIISPLTLDSGVNFTIEVILEEHIHLKYGCSDETRAFQDAVLKEWVKTMKQSSTFLV